METYSFLRELADSWALLLLFLFFIGTWAWAFRPGSRPLHDDAANVVFRHDDGPPKDAPVATPCNGTCENCQSLKGTRTSLEGHS